MRIDRHEHADDTETDDYGESSRTERVRARAEDGDGLPAACPQEVQEREEQRNATGPGQPPVAALYPDEAACDLLRGHACSRPHAEDPVPVREQLGQEVVLEVRNPPLPAQRQAAR